MTFPLTSLAVSSSRSPCHRWILRNSKPRLIHANSGCSSASGVNPMADCPDASLRPSARRCPVAELSTKLGHVGTPGPWPAIPSPRDEGACAKGSVARRARRPFCLAGPPCRFLDLCPHVSRSRRPVVRLACDLAVSSSRDLGGDLALRPAVAPSRCLAASESRRITTPAPCALSV